MELPGGCRERLGRTWHHPQRRPVPRLEQHLDPAAYLGGTEEEGPCTPWSSSLVPGKGHRDPGLGSTTWGRGFGVRRRE